MKTLPEWTETEKLIGYTTGGADIPGLIALCFEGDENLGGFTITGQRSLTALSFPELERINPGHLVIGSSGARNHSLASISAPKLESITGKLDVSYNLRLSHIEFPALKTGPGAGSTGMMISGNDYLASISFPAMESTAFTLNIVGNKYLASLNFPILSQCGAALLISYNEYLPSCSFPSLVTVDGNVTVTHNYALQSASLPVFVPSNGRAISFLGCALDQASVDHILARCVAASSYVSGTVNLSGGTNSAPGPQGVIDKAALQARGVIVITN